MGTGVGVNVVVTGVGMVTPLGLSALQVLEAIRAGHQAARAPSSWAADRFLCPFYAPVDGLDAGAFVPEPKTLRLMSRDAVLAVAAARLAMRDAGISVGRDYAAEDVGLFGATGLAGLSLAEVARLIELSADERGQLDLKRFGAVALKQVRPVLSFKILSNMPLCFVSIFEGIQGANAVYNPWEGQGTRAIATAAQAIQHGEAACALVGGCDVKTHELGFIALQQSGLFDSWRDYGHGCIPGEGAAFLVLEREDLAIARKVRIYARLTDWQLRTRRGDNYCADELASVIRPIGGISLQAIVSAADGDPTLETAEAQALQQSGLQSPPLIQPKKHLGNLFAAAAAVQVGLAAIVAGSHAPGECVLANCFGHGSEQAAFALEGV